MASSKKVSSKAPAKAQRTTKQKNEDLAKLGRYLSGADVTGSVDRRSAISAKRTKDFLNGFYDLRGGGQGSKSPITPAPTKGLRAKYNKTADKRTNKYVY